MPRWNLAWLLGISGVVLLGYAVSHSAPLREKDQDYELVSLVVRVLNEVDHKYVKPLDYEAKRRLVEDMVNGGLTRLDPHSNFINARDYKRFTTSSRGKFGGVGIQLGVTPDRRQRLMVQSPMVGTPAYEAGILAGDVILKIDGKSTENMNDYDAIELIQGEPGQKIVLTVLHAGAKKEVDVEIVRAEIHVPTVMGDLRKPDKPGEWDYLIDKERKIAYIRVTTFSDTTAADLHAALETLKKEGVHGLVLDLRSNPGGLLRSAVDISRMFLNEGRIVSTKGRNQADETYDAKGTALFGSKESLPLVVLINRYSASASEIVAAALQDHDRALVVGERSYGKGSVQNIIEMEGHTSALKLTTASYWRPSGKNIHRFPESKDTDEWGVKPNSGFEVEQKDEDLLNYFHYRRGRDVVQGKDAKPVTPDTSLSDKEKEKKPFIDRPLQKGLEYLRAEIKRLEQTPHAKAA
jgi:carboxyl-terminal processing protease